MGKTVRRPSKLTSAFVRALLRHLEQVGFELGTDEGGRDVLSDLEGDVPAHLSFHNDGVLVGTARLIRRYHDATVPLLASAAQEVGLEVVCHNDLSPCNFVFRGGQPVALIDFDAAAPGTRDFDLGYAAWLWLDLGTPELTPAEQRRRLRVFLNAYGPDAPGSEHLIRSIIERQQVLVAEGERLANREMARWARGSLDWARQHLLATGV